MRVLGRCRPQAHLAGAQSNHQVGDEGVLSFSRAMADHHTPTAALGQLTPGTQTGGRTGGRTDRGEDRRGGGQTGGRTGERTDR